MPEAHAVPAPLSTAQHIDVGELIREVSEVLAAEQPLTQSITELCTLLAHAFGARSISILLDDPDRSCAEYRYDVPLGLVGESAAHAESIPLQIGTQSVGSLVIVPRSRGALAPADMATLETCARYIAVGLRNARLTHTNDDLERLIEVDPLTEVGNRRRFDLTLDSEWRRSLRNRESLSVVMIDVDYFKEFNDRYGHLAGDTCLQQIARAISRATMRASDVVTRYGGEEFAVLLAETDLAGAVAVAENIRLAIERLQIPHAGTSIGSVSISAGVATVTPSAGDAAMTLVEAADLALYRAKSSGRNRIVAGSYISEGSVVERRAITGSTSLPIPLTTFLGRGTEIAQVERLLRTTRLVTLVGPGGVGKTRLALEVAAKYAAERAVTFVDLAPLVAPVDVAPALLAALGLRDDLSRTPEDSIAAHFEKHGALLVIDNCEHVLNECVRLLERFLGKVPGVNVIATSREPLGIRGEGIYRIPALDVPPERERLTTEEALAYPAVHLFVDRAKLVDPAFELTGANLDTVARICRRLDGLPLAIELAAPRLRMMTVEQIERGLDARFSLLTGGGRNALPRQKTLHALIRWGYDLLPPAERRALQRLSTLVGSWPLESAVAIVADGETSAGEVFDLVGSLVDKSFLVAEPHAHEMRYSFLESTRAFAAAALEASGQAPDVARAHAYHFLAFIRSTLETPRREDASAFKAIRSAYDNIQAALHWALGGGDVELGLALADALWPFWEVSGRYRDARRWIERILQLDIAEDRTRPFAVRLTKATMNLGEKRETLDRALMLIPRCLRAQDYQGLHLVRRMAASAYFEMSDLTSAREQIELMLSEPCVRTAERALSLGYLACVELREQNVSKAEALLSEASALDVPPNLRSWIDEYHAYAFFLNGKIEKAIEKARACLMYEESVRNSARVALISITLAWCWILTGRLRRARAALRRALQEPTIPTRPDFFCRLFRGFALLALEEGQSLRAATLLAFASVQAERLNVPPEYARSQEIIAEAERRLGATVGAAQLEAATARGAWLSPECASAEALAI